MQIISNGSSKWAGESIDSIERLIEVLSLNTLDPSVEQFGTFVHRTKDGRFHIFGNFLDISHVFNIYGSLEELRPLAIAIREHRRSARYREAFKHLFGSPLALRCYRRHSRKQVARAGRRRLSSRQVMTPQSAVQQH